MSTETYRKNIQKIILAEEMKKFHYYEKSITQKFSILT